jgi:hypothetical protein
MTKARLFSYLMHYISFSKISAIRKNCTLTAPDDEDTINRQLPRSLRNLLPAIATIILPYMPGAFWLFFVQLIH